MGNNKTCFHCGEPGHIRPNCPYLQGRGGGRGGGGGSCYQGGGGNRFQALGQSGGDGGAGGRGASTSGRSQASKANQDLHPSDVVREDMETEKPKWFLSSYSHKRLGPNDLKGDASVEEVRWMQYQEKRAGVPDFQISSNFRGAFLAKEKEIKALVKAHTKPSLGGPPIHEGNPWLDQITGRSSSPFGSHAAGPRANPFGQQQLAAPAAAPFGAGAAPPLLFGVDPRTAQPAPAFGAGAKQFGLADPLGGSFGPAASPFGQPPAASFGQSLAAPAAGMVFGQPARPLPAATPATLFGQQTHPTPLNAAPAQPPLTTTAPAMLFGQPMQPPAAPAFGGLPQPQQQQATMFSSPAAPLPSLFGNGGASMAQQPHQPPSFAAPSPLLGAFGAGAAPSSPAPPIQAGTMGGGAVNENDAMAQFMAPVFTRGQIPDIPPPLQLCV